MNADLRGLIQELCAIPEVVVNPDYDTLRRRADAALSVAQGQGFVMVPRVPTEAMRAAATKIEWGGDEVDHCWAAMIAAAQTAGDNT